MGRMRKITTETLIIGAGPAGLATAMELLKAGKDFVVIERQSRVGGLSKTYEFKEGDDVFLTDNGPHRFFSKNKYLYEFIEDLLDEKWIQVKRQTRQYIDGKFYDYPVNFFQALKNVGVWRSARMGIDLIIGKIKYKLLRKEIRSFSDYVYAHFGKSLGEFNMINYTEKIWGIPAHTIHTDWAGQRIKGLSVFSLLKDALSKVFHTRVKNKPKSLVDTFYYPEYGCGLIYETIVERLREKGYLVLVDTEPTQVKHNGKRITSVRATDKEGEIVFEFDNLVETVPLPAFIELMYPQAPKRITDISRSLAYRSQVYLFITLDKDKVTDDQWIYIPETHIPIGRISEMKNFSEKMCPPGKTSLFIEFFCFENDNIWNMDDTGLFELGLFHLENLKFITRAEVRKFYVIRQKNVYPIYDLGYKEKLKKLKNWLDTFPNLYYIGRPGRFRYNNQDHSLEMGILAAKSIIEGVRHDIESVGEEKEYQESGKLYEKKQ